MAKFIEARHTPDQTTPFILFSTLAEAEKGAADLVANEIEGWTYTAIPYPGTFYAGSFVIAVRDDLEHFVEYF